MWHRSRAPRTVVVGVALALLAGACTWPQYAAGPARTSWNQNDDTLTTANASSVTTVETAGASTEQLALTGDFVYGTAPGTLEAYPFSGPGCVGEPLACQPAWWSHFDGGATSAPAVDGDFVYVVADTSSHMWTLRAFAARASGDCGHPISGCLPVWTATWGQTPQGGSVDPTLAVADGRVYVLAHGSDTTAPTSVAVFDAAGAQGCSNTPTTCQPLWRTTEDVAPWGAWPTISGGRLFVDTGDHSAILAFDSAGQAGCTQGVCSPLYQFPTGNRATASIANGVLYESGGSTLRAFDATGTTGCSGTPTTCTPLWHADLPGYGSEDPPVVAAGYVFVPVSGGDPAVLAFDAAGTDGCSGSPTVCTPRWGIPSAALPSETVHLAATKNLLVASGWTVVPNLATSSGVALFDLAGSVGCSGVPKQCSALGSVDLGSASGISAPAVAFGRIAVTTWYTGGISVLGLPPA